jgi:transcriptional regulator GlxA family with amidase domain
VEDVASLVAMSRRTFTRFFKRVTGQTLITYLHAFRVDKARCLLAEGGMTVAEIGQAVGFCNQSYFGAIFRRLVHMSALEYINQHAPYEDSRGAARKAGNRLPCPNYDK